MGGAEMVALDVSELPSHTHQASGSSMIADGGSPADSVLATLPSHPHQTRGRSKKADGHSHANSVLGFKKSRGIYKTMPADIPMHPSTIGYTGGDMAHENMPPFLTLNYSIALQGLYPSRN
jgi:microcystin-dependent protein